MDGLALTNAIFSGDPNTSRFQRATLFERSSFYKSGETAQKRYFLKFPQYSDVNLEATITREWDPGSGFSREHTRRNILERRGAELDTVEDGEAVYYAAMGDILMTAVNGVLNMQTGMPQRGEEAKVQACIDRYMRNYDMKIMFSLTDMSLPTAQRFMAAAVLIVRDDGGFLSQMHVNMKKDAERAEFLEARARQGLVQGENGEWIVTTPTVSAKVSRVLELNRERWIARGINVDGIFTENLGETYALLDAYYRSDIVFGGIENQQSSSYDRILSQQWHNNTKPIPGLTGSVSTESHAGKLFAGLLQKLEEIAVSNSQIKTLEIVTLAKEVESITDIPYLKTATEGLKSTAEQRFQKMKDLFILAGYGKIFTTNESSSPHVVSAVTDRPDYINGNLRVRFDVVSGGKHISHARAYLMLNGLQVDLNQALAPDARGQIYIDVPIEKIAGSVPYGSTTSFVAQLKIAVWFEGEGDETAIGGLTNEFVVSWDGTSDEIITTETLSDDPVENAILQRVGFPVRPTDDKQWRSTVGSGWHTLPEDTNAVDLNLGSGEYDKGQPVYAACKGVVTKTTEDGNKFGIVEIKHSADIMINGQMQTVTWWTRYLHMDNIKIKMGQEVDRTTEIGLVSNIKDNNIFTSDMNSHLHFSAYILAEIESKPQKHSIELTNWLNFYHVSITDY